MNQGPALSANSASLTLDGYPFLPVGTYYFTTAEDGWDLSGPRNAALWERDFAGAYGQGKIPFASLPLELGDNAAGLGEVYRYAMAQAHVAPAITKVHASSGILICPTAYQHATLYVLTSQTATEQISFEYPRSAKLTTGRLEAGRAALLLVGTDGKLLASYHWK